MRPEEHQTRGESAGKMGSDAGPPGVSATPAVGVDPAPRGSPAHVVPDAPRFSIGHSFADACAAQRPALYRSLVALTSDRDLAEDLVQETMARALDRAAQYRGAAPLGAWLHRIALNAWRDHLRWRRLRRWVRLDGPGPRDGAWLELPALERPDQDAALDVRRALAKLPDPQRLAIVLRYYHGYDYASIAVALGVAPGTVGSLLARALDHLSADLAPSG